MTKEKFTYELIDNWLYPVSLYCVLMENYVQKDYTDIYKDCSIILRKCLDLYDQMSEKTDQETSSKEESEAIFEFLIKNLNNNTIDNMKEEIKSEFKRYHSKGDEIIEKILLYDQEGTPQDLSKKSLIRFVDEMRKLETGKSGGGLDE